VNAATGCPRVVIIGAGFGGLKAARTLARAPVDVLLVDRHNYHLFQPLLYQVASAGLEAEETAYPIRGILRRQKNARFLMAEVTSVDLGARQVVTSEGVLDYDYLVLAAGSVTQFFGVESVARRAFGLKDLMDAIRLRNHVLTMFEQAARLADQELRARLLTFVIVGGGPTGVELAGAFRELYNHVLKRDYPALDFRQVRVLLVEATDRLLPALAPELGQEAVRRLEAMGVEVRLGAALTGADDDGIVFNDGSRLDCATLVWAAGVRGSLLGDTLGLAACRGSRVCVVPSLQVAGWPDAYAIGDMAYLEGPGGQAYPMVAPVAIQQGEAAARNILRQIKGEQPLPFQYRDRGTMATIGRRAAVAQVAGLRLTGGLAWLAWLFVHLMSLVGFRNRVLVFLNWAYGYLSYDRGARIITET
jgi:NADH:ubiquinone reductase (H+-translocating)